MDNYNIDYYLRLAEQNESIPEEVSNNWAEWVARPVITHNLAPRHARAVLEVVGDLMDEGNSISNILGLLLTISKLKVSGVNINKARETLKNTIENLRKE